MLFEGHPATDEINIVYQVIHIFGLPAILAALVWGIRVWDRGNASIREIHESTKANLAATTEVQTAVGILTTNHIAHVNDELKNLGTQGDKQIDALHSIDSGIKLLVDRGTRGRSTDR
jgi:hypothetical protein